MAACPRCGTQLKEDYGMSQCPGCGAFSFVDMDGNAVIQDVSADPPAENPSDYAEPVEVGGGASPSDYSDPIENVIDVPQDVPQEDFKPFDPFEQTPEAVEAPTNSGFHAGPKLMKPDQSFGPADDPLNINEFANSEVSAAKDGPLLFRVLISGIDTREIRDSIREVLEDPRFAWDSNEIFSKVSKGILAINGLSPVKASILITRIKRLPVQIRWEQYAIAQGQQP